mmetsp:Transcript_8271/g.24869  ORF Transcript_8271/g.24869 Transcript_8271/m.24869 type:complete len:318 (-) Transcript_8271:108-1061(-)
MEALDLFLRIGEIGLALLQERGHPLLLIVGSEQRVKQPPFELETLGQSHLVRRIHGLLGHLHSDHTLGRNDESRPDGFLHDVIGRFHHPGDQTVPLGPLRVNDIPRQTHLHRLGLTDASHETLSTSRARDDAQVNLGLSEFGGVGSVEDIAHHGQLAPAPEGEAGYGRNGGFAEFGDVAPSLEHVRPVRLSEFPLRHFRNVRAGRECLFASRQYETTDAVVVVQRAGGVSQIVEQPVAQGVESPGTVEGDESYASAPPPPLFVAVAGVVVVALGFGFGVAAFDEYVLVRIAKGGEQSDSSPAAAEGGGGAERREGGR